MRNSSSLEGDRRGRPSGDGDWEGGEERSMARKEEVNPPGSFYRKRPALVLGAVGCRATR